MSLFNIVICNVILHELPYLPCIIVSNKIWLSVYLNLGNRTVKILEAKYQYPYRILMHICISGKMIFLREKLSIKHSSRNHSFAQLFPVAHLVMDTPRVKFAIQQFHQVGDLRIHIYNKFYFCLIPL